MMELYSKWSGSVRWVSKKGDLATSRMNAAKLADAISSMSIEVLQRALRGDLDVQILSPQAAISTNASKNDKD